MFWSSIPLSWILLVGYIIQRFLVAHQLQYNKKNINQTANISSSSSGVDRVNAPNQVVRSHLLKRIAGVPFIPITPSPNVHPTFKMDFKSSHLDPKTQQSLSTLPVSPLSCTTAQRGVPLPYHASPGSASPRQGSVERLSPHHNPFPSALPLPLPPPPPPFRCSSHSLFRIRISPNASFESKSCQVKSSPVKARPARTHAVLQGCCRYSAGRHAWCGCGCACKGRELELEPEPEPKMRCTVLVCARAAGCAEASFLGGVVD